MDRLRAVREFDAMSDTPSHLHRKPLRVSDKTKRAVALGARRPPPVTLNQPP